MLKLFIPLFFIVFISTGWADPSPEICQIISVTYSGGLSYWKIYSNQSGKYTETTTVQTEYLA
ncbi:MAG TPA: hypothetical protein VHL11_04945, partial [Phototrophicaceae bacterium]|nr:hypothetical protein [Phototrophicaceae bacterium]